MKCGNEMKMRKWSLQWTQFMQLRKWSLKNKIIQDFNGVWTRDLAIPVRCSINWAMKPLTLGAGQLWVHMFPWKKWVLMIYEINHRWTAEMKWKWRHDRRSECNLCNCVKKPEKKFSAPNVSGFIAQLVEDRTGKSQGHGFKPCWSPEFFFRLLYAIA